MAVEIQVRRGTAAAWESANPIPLSGEPCYEIDTNTLKFGDGVTNYLDLPAYGGGGDIETVNGLPGPNPVLDSTSVGAVSSRQGGGEVIHTFIGLDGTVQDLDLEQGNVQHCAATTGDYTLDKPIGMQSGRASVFTLIIDTTTTGHTPTFFADITWPLGAPDIVWTGGTRQIFQIATYDGTNFNGYHLTPDPRRDQVAWTAPNPIIVTTVGERLHNLSGKTWTLHRVHGAVKVAPSGGPLVVDLHKDGGASVLSTKVSIAAGEFDAEGVVSDSEWLDGSYMEPMVDSFSTPGSGLVLVLVYSEAA